MGMTIEEVNENLYEIKTDAIYQITSKEKEAIDTAIDTMHKYQKMQEILEKVWNIPSCMIDKAECLDKIMEIYKTVRCDSSKDDYKNRVIGVDLNHAEE